jgi:hypothetical protein
MRYLLLVAAIILALLAALKTFVAVKHPNVGPELLTDATLLTLGAIACVAAFSKLGKKKSG